MALGPGDGDRMEIHRPLVGARASDIDGTKVTSDDKRSEESKA